MEKDLIEKYKSGDNHALDELYFMYKSKILSIAKKYFISDGSSDDVVQEGMMGFVKAINTFDNNKGEFYPYMKKLVEQQIINAIKKSNSLKNIPLNERVNLNNQGEIEVGDVDATFGLPSDTLSPELAVLNEENKKVLNEYIEHNFSDKEKQVLKLYLSGFSYCDIIQKLDINYKSVDNTLSRIKTKLQNFKKGD